jgi:hypothetical protein
LSQKNRYFILALLLFCSLQALDGILTHCAINGGLVQEANWLVERVVGEGSFPLFKLAGAFLCVILLWFIHERFPRLALLTISTLLIFYSIVVTWNLYILSAI